MRTRGRMQEGMIADIAIFDSENVTDNADYKVGTNGLPSTGIPYVLVNGTVMVRDSKVVDGVFPGQPIRYPIEEMGRFEPLEKEGYLENLLAPEIPNDALDHGAGDPQTSVTPEQGGFQDGLASEPLDPFDPLAQNVTIAAEPRSDTGADWFALPGEKNLAELFFCEVHRRYEGKDTYLKDFRSFEPRP
jgi:N-acyl-D-amino-acid deacylase